MGFAHRAFVAAGVGFAASVLVGCGSSGGGTLLSTSQASNLTAQLNRVSAALNAQDCSQAQQYLQDFQTSVENMGGVNSTLISNLDRGVSTVESLANQDCRTTVTTPKTHTRTQTTTTATQTTQTFTNPSTDTYTQPTYTQPTDTTTSTDTTPATNTSGGGCLTCGISTTTATTTSTPTVTNQSGGGGLGGTDTSASSSTTTTDNGGGF